jgi:hypothetical protein
MFQTLNVGRGDRPLIFESWLLQLFPGFGGRVTVTVCCAAEHPSRLFALNGCFPASHQLELSETESNIARELKACCSDALFSSPFFSPPRSACPCSAPPPPLQPRWTTPPPPLRHGSAICHGQATRDSTREPCRLPCRQARRHRVHTRMPVHALTKVCHR